MARRTPDPEDQAILKALAADDLDRAFALLKSRYWSRLVSFATRLLRDPALAEDVIQETFLQVLQDIDGLRKVESLEAWLLAVARNRAIDGARKRSRSAKHLDANEPSAELPDLVDAPDLVAMFKERSRAIETCLGKLKPDVREAVLLRFGRDLKLDEIARLQRVDVDAVRMRISRALPLLRRCLEARGGGDGD